MGRIRTLKPEFFKHEDLYELEKQSGFPIRVAFAGLLTVADREGRFAWRPRALKTDVLPYDDLDFELVLEALVSFRFLVKYEVDGKVYAYFPNWSEHQVIPHREAVSRIPEHPNVLVIKTKLDIRPVTPGHCPVTPGNARALPGHARGEEEGKGKGREEEKESTKTLVELSELRPVSEPDVSEEVALVERAFAYYCRKVGRDPQRYVLTPARRKVALTRLRERRRIRGSLEAVGDEFKQAIDNLATSEFHVTGGYVGWTENIFKSADELDKRLNWKQGGSNGTFKGKTGHSVDAATRAIQEIEDCAAADRVRDSEAGEAGRAGLPSLCDGSGTSGSGGPRTCIEGTLYPPPA
jgi:hypothetical protein